MATIRYPVVDGDSGDVDVYGFATTEMGAKRVAGRWFVDPIHSAYIAEDVTTSDGQLLPKAWVVLTTYGAGVA